MQNIDLNCDMGESFGAFNIGQDEVLMEYVSSVNIACGFHGGDPSVMNKTVKLAAKKNLAIGAHPGYPDLQGFGRREMKFSPSEIYDMVVYQVGALKGFATVAGARLHHVKPHGALYNTAAKDPAIASAIAHAVSDVDRTLIFVGLSGSAMIREAGLAGLHTASEVFADRTYQDDGSLTPRHSKEAMIANPAAAAEQVLQMVRRKTVTSVNGKEILVNPQTVCIHGDAPHAPDFAMALVALLKKNHVAIQRL